MDTHHILNGTVSLVAAVALSYIVLSPRWNEGLIAKVGLIMMILSLLSTAALTLLPSGMQDWAALWNAGTALRLGVVLVVLGYYLRRRHTWHPLRRRTDWADLDEDCHAHYPGIEHGG